VKVFIRALSQRKYFLHMLSIMQKKVLKIQRWIKRVFVVRWFLYASMALKWNKIIKEAPIEEVSQFTDGPLRLTKADKEMLKRIPGPVKLEYLRAYYKKSRKHYFNEKKMYRSYLERIKRKKLMRKASIKAAIVIFGKEATESAHGEDQETIPSIPKLEFVFSKHGIQQLIQDALAQCDEWFHIVHDFKKPKIVLAPKAIERHSVVDMDFRSIPISRTLTKRQSQI